MPPSPSSALAQPNEPPPCEQAQAIREQTEAMDRQTAKMGELVDELKASTKAFLPAADAVAELGAAQRKLCNFIVGNRLKITAATISVLLGVGAISPNAAEAIKLAIAGIAQ